MNNYLLLFIANLATIIAATAYAYAHRKHVGEMHGMMIGMTLGMVSGLLTATLIVLPTGNFSLGVMAGTLVGLAFGIPLGKLGGHLGVMEGVMAGPMGGMMGAMLGQMIRPFDLTLFIPFFSSLILLSTIGISYATHCGCCGSKPKPLSQKFIAVCTIGAVILLIISLSLNFSLETPTPPAAQTTELKLPAYLQNINKETKGTAIVHDNLQEINVSIGSSAYTPNTIEAKAGMPLRITFTAGDDAGCGREVVIPDFGIKKIVSGTASIDITPKKAGNYPFHCSMDMLKGKIVVS